MAYLIQNSLDEFAPIDVCKALNVTNKTIINRCVALTQNGFIIPVLVKERIRAYRLSTLTKDNVDLLLDLLKVITIL